MSFPRNERLGLAGLLLVLVATAATLLRTLHTSPNFDEAGYSAALDALRHGQELGTDVYLVQPPGFYILLQALASVAGADLETLRLGLLAVSLLGLVAAYCIGRRFGGPIGGVLAAGLTAVTPPFATFSSLVESDPPSLAFGLVSLALAAYSFRPPNERRWLAALGGAALACSILVKLFTGTMFVPLIALAFAWRTSARTVLAFCAGGIAVVAVLAATHVQAIDEFWEGAVSGQLANREIEAPGHLDNLGRVADFFSPDIPASYLLALGTVAAIALSVRRRRQADPIWPLWTFTAAAGLFTVWMRPLLDHHLVLLAAALAIAAGASMGAAIARLGSRRAVGCVAVAALVAALGLAQQWRQLGRNVRPVEARQLWAADLLRRHSTRDQLVISDLPYSAVLADRRLVGETVDTSWGRVISGKLSAADVAAAAEANDVPIVIVGRMLRYSPGLAAKLADRYTTTRRFEDAVAYIR